MMRGGGMDMYMTLVGGLLDYNIAKCACLCVCTRLCVHYVYTCASQ
jgi:hypothetical protein